MGSSGCQWCWSIGAVVRPARQQQSSVCWLCAPAAPQETIRQQEWKIERLTKDNRALEASNCELRAQLEALKEENLQVCLCTTIVCLSYHQLVVHARM